MTISRMQQPRQQYGLGSIVKKAVKGVSKGIKKFAKSDLGKIALIGATAFGIPGTQFGGLLGRAGFGGAAPSIFGKSGGINALFSKGATHPFSEAVKSMGKGLGKDKVALGIGAASTLAGILASDPDMTEDQAEELKQDPVALRNYLTLYYSNLNPDASPMQVDRFVEANMYADGGRVNYAIGSNPAIKAPRASMMASPHTGNMQAPGRVPPSRRSTQLGSPQGGTSLYGDVLEYLKRQGKDAPQRISPEGIDGIAMPYGGGSFNQSGGAINTAMPFVGGGPGTGMLQTSPSAPTVPMPKPPSNVAPTTPEVDSFLKRYYQQSYDNYKDIIAKATKGGDAIAPNGMDLFRKGSLERQHMSREELSDAYNKIKDSQIYQDGFDPKTGKPIFKEREIDFGLYVPTMTEYLLDQGDIKTAAKSLQDPENYKYKDYGDMLQKTGGGYQYERALAGDPNYRIIEPALELYKEYRGYNDGGRIGYRSGDVVDQASGIMGLPKRVNKAGVKELDLRESGGFIPPVGVKEKADDIPAMLSNNEFVFTADAVRGMGDGNVNKGAQRMYDMMKKLEEGGRV